MRLCLMLVAALLLTGCFRRPSERSAYRVACEAVRSRSDFPAGAVVPRMRDASIQVLKCAARVDLECRLPEAGGQSGAVRYTVWLKRIAMRWELDRCWQAKRYPGG